MRISQIVISSKIKYAKRVYAFTEQGVAMFTPLNLNLLQVHKKLNYIDFGRSWS
jgi:hypothetical protein